MKNILKSILAVGVLFTTFGCSKDQTVTEFNPTDENPAAAYFSQKTVSQEFGSASTGDQKLYVDVYRPSAIGEATVGINRTVPADGQKFYGIPESVTFLDGEYKAVLEVTIHDVQNFAKGATYSATISVGDHHKFSDSAPLQLDKNAAKTRSSIDITKFTSVTLSVQTALDWQPVYIPKDMANLVKEKPAGTPDADWYVMGDDSKPMLMTADWQDFWPMADGNKGLSVQRAAGTTVFRIQNWGEGKVNIIFTIDTDPAHAVTFNGAKYPRVVLTSQDAGVLYQNNPVNIVDFPSYTSTVTYDAAPCCLIDNQIALTLYWYVPALGGGFSQPTDGLTDIITFNTGEAPEPAPEVAVDYVGLKTSATGVKTHEISFAPNGDAASYYATAVNIDGITSEEALDAKLAEVKTQIEAGTYKSDITVLKLTAKDQRAWELGVTPGEFAAVAFSYSADGSVDNTDYKTFIYNPNGDPRAVNYQLFAGAGGFGTDNDFTDYSQGYFGDNSALMIAKGVDITAVKYAFITKAKFIEAGLEGADDAKLLAYVNANGRALNDAALKDMNNPNPKVGSYTFMSAAAATEYKLLTATSNPDATAVKVIDVTTEAAETPTAIKAQAIAVDMPKNGIYKHTNILGGFTGTHIVGGHSLILPTDNKALSAYLTIDDKGVVTLNKDVTNAMMVDLVESNGGAFTTGTADSDLFLMNTGELTMAASKATPNTRYIVLASADYGMGAANFTWAYSVGTTGFAPAVNFTQTVSVSGNKLMFTWKSAVGLDGIFKTKQVAYALVSKSALTDAGVDMDNLANLNDFKARLAAAKTQSEIDAINAQERNAAKVSGVLSANVKYFKGDAAALVNSANGVMKQFENLAAGEYALISLASDSYNTKLTVSPVSIK